jgi:hypothetical protein
MTTTRQRIHQLIDTLPGDELATIELLLSERHVTNNPFLHALAQASEDDEPLTQEEQKAIQEGLDAIAGADVVPNDDLRRALRR